MQPYYSQGMIDPRMAQMQAMNSMQNPGMMGMNPMAAAQMSQMGMGMAGMGGTGYGQAYMPQYLGYEYQLPASTYRAQPGWGAWDIANAQYGGSRLERGFFDNIINSLSNFFGTRHLSEEAARDAHRRVYYRGEGEDAGNKTLGGGAAYQAYLIWDRDHYSAYHSFPSQENRERLVGLAVAELFSLWDRVSPRSSRANPEEASEYAAATAKYLFDRHYDLTRGTEHRHHHHHSRHSGYGADDDSDDESDGRRARRRSGMYQIPYAAGMQPGNAIPGMGGIPPSIMASQGMMPGMMMQPGLGMNPMAMGMGMGGNPMAMGGMGMQNPMQGGLAMNPMMMGGMNPMMNQMNQMGAMGGMGGMGQMGQMGGMGAMGSLGHPGASGLPMGEAQAVPGMHPYNIAGTHGVAYGNQPIDDRGYPTFPGGPGRSYYAYGQPRYGGGGF